jgi:CheY-like chemotaxis protein
MQALDLARVLIVHDEIASRLTLQTILRAGGYAVDVAASPAEAFAKLDTREYELVLSAPDSDVLGIASKVLSYARVKEYRPATALITASATGEALRNPRQPQISIYTEDIAQLLAHVAELIGMRASRRSERALRQLATV